MLLLLLPPHRTHRTRRTAPISASDELAFFLGLIFFPRSSQKTLDKDSVFVFFKFAEDSFVKTG
jgi:hypothetical protein